MKLISPDQFRDAFVQSTSMHTTAIAALWDEYRQYTGFVRSTLLPDVSTRLGLGIHSGDYYTLDAVLYESKDTDHFKPHLTYARYIAVAIEHENDAKSTYIEMNKLQLFNAPLKVLITYDGGNDGGVQLKTLLSEYGRIIRDADVFGDFETSRRILLIIGQLVDDTPTWRFYTFKNQKLDTLV